VKELAMSPTTTPGLVVVGVDFSKDNAAAVDYAAAVATRRHLPLELLYAVDPQTAPPTYLAMSMHEITEEAEGELADQANAVRQDNPGLEVTTHFLAQSPTDALVEASERAGMVVLGSRGHGSFDQLLLGSVAWRVTSRASAPVVLVRPGELVGRVAGGPVVVGVDGSECSRKALAFAFDEASSRRTDLIAVTVWALPHPEGLAIGRDWPAQAADWQKEMELDAARILSEALAGTGEQHPEVPVSEVVVHGLNIPQTLLEVASAKSADLIVVGARGTHALAELVLGAVGVQLSQHADRTVAVVHA
jgi:nucleotide-binding universal stress UspA family protein